MNERISQMLHQVESGRLYEFDGLSPKVADSVFLADGARIIGDVTLGENVSVWFNAVVRGDVERVFIDARTNIQDNAVIHVTHFKNPTYIGKAVTIGHGAIVHGCTVEDSALIGMNAVVLDRAVVGRNSLVAAGSVVRQGMIIPEGVLFAGVPGRIIKELSAEELEMVREGAVNYELYVQHYRGRLPSRLWAEGSFAGFPEGKSPDQR